MDYSYWMNLLKNITTTAFERILSSSHSIIFLIPSGVVSPGVPPARASRCYWYAATPPFLLAVPQSWQPLHAIFTPCRRPELIAAHKCCNSGCIQSRTTLTECLWTVYTQLLTPYGSQGNPKHWQTASCEELAIP